MFHLQQTVKRMKMNVTLRAGPPNNDSSFQAINSNKPPHTGEQEIALLIQ